MKLVSNHRRGKAKLGLITNHWFEIIQGLNRSLDASGMYITYDGLPGCS